jgi:hypothetical protein
MFRPFLKFSFAQGHMCCPIFQRKMGGSFSEKLMIRKPKTMTRRSQDLPFSSLPVGASLEVNDFSRTSQLTHIQAAPQRAARHGRALRPRAGLEMLAKSMTAMRQPWKGSSKHTFVSMATTSIASEALGTPGDY